MNDPSEQATADEHEEPPDLDALADPDDLLDGERTRDDFLSVALQLREPTTIAEIADRADRGDDAAREYMRWFETIGLVRRASDDPEQYVTNRSYLYWRRVDRIRRTLADSDIVERLQGVVDELDELRDRFDASGPGAVDVVSAARDADVDVETVWRDLSRWKTLLARRDLLEDALDRDGDRYRFGSGGDPDGPSRTRRPA